MSIRDELQRLYEDEGRLTPALVLDAAREPDSPLHDSFEWDDGIAAEQHRLAQARVIIRKVRVRYVDASGDVKQVRRYHAPRASDESDYRDQDDIRRNPMLRKLLLRQMERDIAALVDRYEGIQEFWSIMRKVRRRKAS